MSHAIVTLNKEKVRLEQLLNKVGGKHPGIDREIRQAIAEVEEAIKLLKERNRK